MLSQAVISYYNQHDTDTHAKGFSWTGVSECPYATYLNYHKLNPRTEKDIGYARLRMKNGKPQELEILEDLHAAGFKTRYSGYQQLNLHTGKSKIPGHPDGLITVDSREDLLEIKAMDLHRYTNMKQYGLETGIRCQVQGYMASDELAGTLSRCWVYFKHKDTCRPSDIEEPYNPAYSRPIIEATDTIILDKWEPKKEVTNLCSNCRHYKYCWGENVIDLSEVSVLDLPDVVDKWKQGDYYLKMGKYMKDEAEVELVKSLPADTTVKTVFINDLRMTRVVQKRNSIPIDKFVEIFGAHRLPEVLQEKISSFVRITIQKDLTE